MGAAKRNPQSVKLAKALRAASKDLDLPVPTLLQAIKCGDDQITDVICDYWEWYGGNGACEAVSSSHLQSSPYRYVLGDCMPRRKNNPRTFSVEVKGGMKTWKGKEPYYLVVTEYAPAGGRKYLIHGFSQTFRTQAEAKKAATALRAEIKRRQAVPPRTWKHKSNPRKRKGQSKKQFVEEVWAKRAPKMPSHSYGPRKGLEGPFQYGSGKVLYWDAKEGAYYDPGADMYLSNKDAQAFIMNPRKRKNALTRRQKENAIAGKFPPDSKRGRGDKRVIMLTGDSAKIIGAKQYSRHTMSKMSAKDIDTLYNFLVLRKKSNPRKRKNPTPVGKAQKFIYAYAQKRPKGFMLTDITYRDARMHFGTLMKGASALAKKGLIDFDGAYVTPRKRKNAHPRDCKIQGSRSWKKIDYIVGYNDLEKSWFAYSKAWFGWLWGRSEKEIVTKARKRIDKHLAPSPPAWGGRTPLALSRKRNSSSDGLLKYQVWMTKDGNRWVVHSHDNWSDFAEVEEMYFTSKKRAMAYKRQQENLRVGLGGAVNPSKRKNPPCRGKMRGGSTFVPTPECRGQAQAMLLFFHEMKRSDPKFTLKDAWEISKGNKPVTKLSKKTLAKAKRDAPVAEQTVLAFNPRKRKNPGKFFVVVDTSVPGGKWVRSAFGSTIHTKATLRQADRQAESLERTTGRPHQVIDAEWYGPAREVLIKTGMIGKTNPRKRKNSRKEINAYSKRYTLTSFSEKYFGKNYKDVPLATRREFWSDFKYAFVGGLDRYKKETTSY